MKSYLGLNGGYQGETLSFHDMDHSSLSNKSYAKIIHHLLLNVGDVIAVQQVPAYPDGSDSRYEYCPFFKNRELDTTMTSQGNGFPEKASQLSDSAPQTIGYYISMQTGDTIKSSEIANIDPAYLAKTKYEPIQGHVNISGNRLNISIFEHYPGSNNFESVILKIYDSNNLVTEKNLEVQQTDNDSKIYSLSYDAGSQNISKLVLQVKYTNGNTFARDIY